MIEEEAVVVGITAGGKVLVEKMLDSACCRCASPCLTIRLNRHSGNKKIPLPVESPHAVDIGDRVVVGIAETATLQATAWLYLFPLFGLMLGAVAGHSAADLLAWTDDEASALGGFGGLLIVIIAMRWETLRTGKGENRAIITRKLP